MTDGKDEIVISGMSGRFPESDSIDEFADNLFNHVDMITEDDRRWPIGLFGLPARAGKIRELSKFDAQFFGVHGKQADMMDPQVRMLLELTHESICDAGRYMLLNTQCSVLMTDFRNRSTKSEWN